MKQSHDLKVGKQAAPVYRLNIGVTALDDGQLSKSGSGFQFHPLD